MPHHQSRQRPSKWQKFLPRGGVDLEVQSLAQGDSKAVKMMDPFGNEENSEVKYKTMNWL